MNSEILRQLSSLRADITNHGKEITILKEQKKDSDRRSARQEKEITILKERMNRIYDGWKKTKSELAKLTIRLVQRDDLQKILKPKTNRSRVVTTSTKIYKKR